MAKYCYDGPVYLFNHILANKWHGETIADNVAKARSNLMFQAKKEFKLDPTAKISLPNSVV